LDKIGDVRDGECGMNGRIGILRGCRVFGRGGGRNGIGGGR